MQKFPVGETRRDMSYTRLFRVTVRAGNADSRPVTAVSRRYVQTVHQLRVHGKGPYTLNQCSNFFYLISNGREIGIGAGGNAHNTVESRESAKQSEKDYENI